MVRIVDIWQALREQARNICKRCGHQKLAFQLRCTDCN